jgi:alpha-tubulin suppressor-like RCC1 family protein
VHTWGYNDYWQLGYEVTGFLKSGQSYDLVDEPTAVDLPLSKAKPQPSASASAASSQQQTQEGTDGAAAAAAAAAGAGAATAEPQLSVGLLASSDKGMVAVSADGRSVVLWGFSKFFEPQLVVPAGAEPLDGKVVQATAGAEHVLLLTERGSVYTWGAGAVLGVAQPLRQQYALARHGSFGQLTDKVLAVACGAHSSAAIVV